MTDKERLEEIKEIDQEVSNGFALEDLDLNTMTVVNREHFNWLIEQAERVQELEQQNKNYRKAIKECIERMNEGGAGTRSFVYEKLIEVLEGNNDA